MFESRTNLPEALLVKRLQAGDEEAFRLIVQQHHTAMVRLAAVIVSEMALAEDVVQETWIAVLKAVRYFEERSSLKTWLFSIVVNRARTHLKREQRHVNQAGVRLDTKEGDAAELIPSSGELYPESIADKHEFQQIVSQSIELLPRNQQNVVRLRHLHGFSSAEVSKQLGISEVNQRVLLHRARKQMRSDLVRYDSTYSG